MRDSHQYVGNRVPSYTDRVLYWAREEDALYPVRYDCVWDLTVSDHKPVYCTFRMRAVGGQQQQQTRSGASLSTLPHSNSSTSGSGSAPAM